MSCVHFSILSPPYRFASHHHINTNTHNVFLSDVILMRNERLSIKNIYHRNNVWGICILSFRFGWHNKPITFIQHHTFFALVLIVIFSSLCLCLCLFICCCCCRCCRLHHRRCRCRYRSWIAHCSMCLSACNVNFKAWSDSHKRCVTLEISGSCVLYIH